MLGSQATPGEPTPHVGETLAGARFLGKAKNRDKVGALVKECAREASDPGGFLI